MLHRAKRTPGQFMMRLRTPNGIVTSDQMRFYADSVSKYGDEIGVIDITTRANIVSMFGKSIELLDLCDLTFILCHFVFVLATERC
jgi:dissimilatory sulfite reductase (desulfoviridin) alpha/beta subunit